MNKYVYIVQYESKYSDYSYSSGIVGVFDTLEKAQAYLQMLKQDEINERIDNGYEVNYDNIKEESTWVRIEFWGGDEYTKYSIGTWLLK